MKLKQLFIMIFMVLSMSAYSQSTINGTVVDSETSAPLSGVSINEKGTENGVMSDINGNFVLETESTSGVVIISYGGFINGERTFSVTNGVANVGTFGVNANMNVLEDAVIVGKGVIDLASERETPIAVSTITATEIQDKGVGNVEFPEVMKNTPSVYISNQAGGFGDSQMFLRGFDQTNTAFLLNGQPINGMEDGKMYWSNWSGMSDVANAIQVQRGLGSSKLAISSVGGTVNIVTRATDKKEGGMVRYMMGNDSYMKGTVAYNTGLKGKWGLSMMFDYWQSHRKFAKGTAGEGQSYFVSVGFKPNDNHNLNFMVFGAPQWHHQNFSKSKSAYDTYGRKYNDNYGYYNGEGHSLRKNYYHKPVANLNWDWNINENTSLSTVAYASMGRGGGTGLLGNGQKNVPGGVMEDGYINFDAIEEHNLTIPDGIGEGKVGTALRSSVNNHMWYGLVSNLNMEFLNNFKFNFGTDIRFYKGDHFRQLSELYGLNGWRDTGNANFPNGNVVTNTFDTNPWASLFNYAKKGDRIAYDYSEQINYQGVFGQLEYAKNGFSIFTQGSVSNQSYQGENRYDFVDSKKSDKISKLGYNIKGGVAYKFGNNTLFGNAGHYSRQPFKDNVLSENNVDLRDPAVDNEKITGFEVGYSYKNRGIALNVNLYHTTWGNRFFATNGKMDLPGDGGVNQEVDVTYMFTDLTQVHKGIEVDFQAKVSRQFTLRGFTSLGDWKYDGDSPFNVRRDDTYEIDPTLSGKEDFSGMYIGNAPQFTFGMGMKFEPKKGLYMDADLNYYARLWGELSPNSALKGVQSEELAPYATVDFGVTYEHKISGNNMIRFRGNIYNALNSVYVGRKDGYGYYYGLGRTFNAGIQYSF